MGRPADQKIEIISVKHESMKVSAVDSIKPSATESDFIKVKPCREVEECETTPDKSEPCPPEILEVSPP